MMQERTKAEKLAGALDAWVSQKLLPGLLPATATEAATMLREQDKELATLRTALAAKDHVVEVEVVERNYRKEVRATFVIADPRIYYGELFVDAYIAEVGPPDWVLHTARSLARAGTAQWMRDIEEKTYAAAQQALRRIEARRAET
jgi:hypothetical protein